MKTIQLVTPQNVLIEHELAGVVLRALAFVIDQVAIFVFLIFMFVMFQLVGFTEELFQLSIFLFVIPVYFLYSLILEAYNYGQTLGKLMVGIKVRRLDGNEITFTDAATRWLMRVPDIFISAGSLAALLISSTERSQRLGDILAGTIVIRQTPGSTIPLDALLRISTVEDYEPKYPEVLRLDESDIVTIKQVLIRYNKYQNDAHKTAILALVKKLKSILDIDELNEKPSEFLRTLIKDFIVLTR